MPPPASPIWPNGQRGVPVSVSNGSTGQTDRVRGTRRGWLKPNVRVLSLVSLLQEAASELLYPVLPIFITSVLGAPAAVVGLVEGIAEGAASLTRLVSGRLADRYPKRRLVGAGYGLAAVGKVLIAVAGAWPVVLAGRAVDRLGKGIRGAPRDALLVEGVPVESRGRVFGFHRAADTAGAVLGPLAGLALYELLGQQIRPLLVIAVIPAVASALLVLAVREAPRPLLDRRGLLPRGPAAAPAHARGGLLPRGPAAALAAVGRVLRPPPDRGPGFARVAAVLVGFGVVNVPD